MKLRSTPPLLLALAAVIVQVTPLAPSLLEFNREALALGEYWRIFTGHLVHFNLSHFTWDVATLFLLAALLPSLSVGSWLRLLGGAAIVISAGVWFFAPQLEFYRGLSGLDCALFGAVVAGFVVRALRERDIPLFVVTLLAGLGFLAKCQWELHHESTLFAQSHGSFVPMPLAHLLGSVWGMLSILIDLGFGELRDLHHSLKPARNLRGKRGAGIFLRPYTLRPLNATGICRFHGKNEQEETPSGLMLENERTESASNPCRCRLFSLKMMS